MYNGSIHKMTTHMIDGRLIDLIDECEIRRININIDEWDNYKRIVDGNYKGFTAADCCDDYQALKDSSKIIWEILNEYQSYGTLNNQRERIINWRQFQRFFKADYQLYEPLNHEWATNETVNVWSVNFNNKVTMDIPYHDSDCWLLYERLNHEWTQTANMVDMESQSINTGDPYSEVNTDNEEKVRHQNATSNICHKPEPTESTKNEV